MSLVGKNVGNYKVIAKIGEGGMGSVYLGEHPMIGKRVAIKTLHPDLATKEDIVSRFFTEAKAVNDIGHPNIVDIVDFGKMKDPEEVAEVVYFVMEFLDGEGLNSRLKRDGVSPRETIHIMRQCGSALTASHRKGVVHRDLKPENIYLVTRGDDKNYTKLLDFGIAKLTGGDSSLSQHKTRTGLVIGTPTYMSPEQCEGKGNIDHRSDIYSLGVVMYEMLTGRVPFPGDGFGEILVAHLTKTPELPTSIRADVPSSLESIVMHALEKDKNRRFQTMDEFVAALDDPSAHLAAYGSPSGKPDSSVKGTMVLDAPTTSPPPRTITGQGPRPATGQGPRPTTLSGANGELGGDGPPPRSKVPLFAGLALLLVAGGGGAFVVIGRLKPPVAIVEPVKPKAPEMVHVMLDSSPRGAQILRAGVSGPLGVTPFRLELKANDPEFDVQLKLEGYKDETKTVTTTRDHDVLVALAKVEAPPVAVVVPPPVPVVEPKKEHPTKKPGGGGHTTGKKSGDKDDVMEPQFN